MQNSSPVTPESTGRLILTGFFLLVLLILALPLTASDTNVSNPANDLFSSEEQKWLNQHLQLTIGVMDNWPPISKVNFVGQAEGIDIDIVEQLNRRLGGRLNLVVGPWNEIYRDIQQQRLDLIMGITPSDPRKKLINFTNPYMSVPHVIIARHNINEFYADEYSLQGKTLALEKDFVNVSYFRKNHPQVSIKTYQNTLAALEAVSRGDADAYAGSRLVVLYLIEKQLLSNLKIHGRLSKPPTELAIGSRKDQPILASIIQKTLDDISSDNIREIVNRWVKLGQDQEVIFDLQLTSEEESWLRDNPQIRIGAMSNWPPFNFTDKNNKPLGIGADLVHEINKRLNNQLQIVSGDWKHIYQQTSDGKLDAILDITPKESREPYFNFTTPYLDIPHVIVAPQRKNIYRNEDDLAGKTLALESGFGNVKYFRQNYPGTQIKLYPDTEQALEAVSRQEADAYAGNRVVALHLIEKLALSNLKVHGRLRKSGSILALGIRKDAPLLHSILQKTLNSIGKDKLRDIKNNWIMLTRDSPDRQLNLTNSEKKWLQQHQIIPIGVDGNWPPIDFYDNQLNHVGITSDYLKLIGEKIGVEFAAQRSDSFKEMLTRVQQGALPVGATISYREEREQTLLFSKPFYHVQKVIIVREDDNSINGIRDLYGKTVAIEDGFLTMRQLQEKHPQIKLLPVDSTVHALEKLSYGKADAYVGNQVVAGWLSREQQIDNLKVINDAGLGSGPQNFAVSRNRPEWFPLIHILNKALDSIGIEQRIALENRWLGQPDKSAREYPALRLDNDLKKWLEAHPQIKPGIDTEWPPLEYLDQNGKYSGLSSDYMNYFARVIGLEMEPPPPISWVEVLNGLQNKTLDLAPMLIATPEREQFLNFTKPYINFPVVIFNRRGETLLNGLADLERKKVGVVGGYAIAEFLARDFPGINLIPVKDTLGGLKALSVGQIEAYIDVLSVGAYIMSSNGMTNLQVAASTPYQHDFAIGVRKDWPELVTILNHAIDLLPVERKNEFLRKWLVVRYENKIDYTLLYWAIGVFLLIVSMLMYRARIMARVNTELQEGRERLALSLEGGQLGSYEITFEHERPTLMSWDETFAKHHDLPPKPADLLSADDFFNYFSSEYVESIRQSFTRYLKGETDDFAVEYQTRSNKRWIATKGRIFQRDDSGWAQRIVGVSQDISDRVEAQQAIERSSQFKSQFLANMSHEIRTPMNAIIGLAYLLSRTPMNRQQLDYTSSLQKSAQILLGLIDDILDLSKIEAGQLNIDQNEFNLVELLEDLTELSRVRIQSPDVHFQYLLDSNIPVLLKADQLRLNQILNNLISNAIKFTEQGQIILNVQLEEMTSNDQCRVLFSVEDSGIGIDHSRLDTLFEPFVQEDGSTTRKYGGTGLGLSISRHLARLMGGELNASSIKGKGSRFYFELPMTIVHEKPAELPIDFDKSRLRSMKVLLVDDNQISLKILSDTLKSLSLDISEASSGQEAIELITQPTSQYDLLLIDWRMPEMDGEQLSLEIGRLLPADRRPIVILMTAYGKEISEHHIDKRFIDGILVKPVMPSAFINSILQIQHNRGDLGEPGQPAIKHEMPQLLSGHVILAEDNPVNQQVTQEILEQMGLQVTVCDNGARVLATLQHSRPDLILMDIQMPKMDGHEATRRIRKMPGFEKLPIIAMTANAMAEDRKKSLEAGMQDHLSKPVEPDTLHQVLSSYLNPSDDVTARPSAVTAPEITWPDRIDGINIRQGIAQVGGNELLYRKLLADFVTNHQHLQYDMKSYYENGETEKALRSAHTLKGVCANIGAERLHLAASAINQNLKYEQPIEDAIFEEFYSSCDELFNGLRQLFKETDSAQIASADSAASHPDFNALHDSLLQGNADSREQLSQLKSQLRQIHGEKLVRKLQQLVDDYEYEQAGELLETSIGKQP